MQNNLLTNLTKAIGEKLAKVREANKLIEEKRKIINPTFFEILEELPKDDSMLALSLINWYINKYANSYNDKEFEKYLKSIGIDDKNQKISVIEDVEFDYRGYGGSCGGC